MSIVNKCKAEIKFCMSNYRTAKDLKNILKLQNRFQAQIWAYERVASQLHTSLHRRCQCHTSIIPSLKSAWIFKITSFTVSFSPRPQCNDRLNTRAIASNISTWLLNKIVAFLLMTERLNTKYSTGPLLVYLI